MVVRDVKSGDALQRTDSCQGEDLIEGQGECSQPRQRGYAIAALQAAARQICSDCVESKGSTGNLEGGIVDHIVLWAVHSHLQQGEGVTGNSKSCVLGIYVCCPGARDTPAS